MKNWELVIFNIFIENDQILSIRKSETIIKKLNERITVLNNDNLCIVEDSDDKQNLVLYE